VPGIHFDRNFGVHVPILCSRKVPVLHPIYLIPAITTRESGYTQKMNNR
jgi:hypothetical protein